MNDSDIHWVVRLNRRNRSVFFALLFPVLGTHLLHIGAGSLQWLLLVLQLLVYPQCVYWRALYSADPLRAEMHNLLVDGVLLGAWAAFWGLPLWIGFMLFIGVCLNLMIFQGLRGLWKAMAAMCAGVALVAAAGALHFSPDTTLLTSGLCIGVLTLYLLIFAYGGYTRGLALRESREQLREQLAQITSLQTRLQDQAVRDPLTGLFNRRHLDRALTDELVRCRREGTPLALVMVDIDRFKDINDGHGHLAGDEVIRRLAALLARRVRGDGLVCRFGGEEFLLMLPGMPATAAFRFAEELRREFESLCVEFDEKALYTTLSFGVAGVPEHAPEPRSLVQMADRALYAAKLQGRNRVVLSTRLGDGVAGLAVE